MRHSACPRPEPSSCTQTEGRVRAPARRAPSTSTSHRMRSETCRREPAPSSTSTRPPSAKTAAGAANQRPALPAGHGPADPQPTTYPLVLDPSDAGNVDDEVGSQPSPVRLLLGDTRSQILRMRGLTRLRVGLVEECEQREPVGRIQLGRHRNGRRVDGLLRRRDPVRKAGRRQLHQAPQRLTPTRRYRTNRRLARSEQLIRRRFAHCAIVSLSGGTSDNSQ